jgi:hypothetical protein
VLFATSLQHHLQHTQISLKFRNPRAHTPRPQHNNGHHASHPRVSVLLSFLIVSPMAMTILRRIYARRCHSTRTARSELVCECVWMVNLRGCVTFWRRQFRPRAPRPPALTSNDGHATARSTPIASLINASLTFSSRVALTVSCALCELALTLISMFMWSSLVCSACVNKCVGGAGHGHCACVVGLLDAHLDQSGCLACTTQVWSCSSDRVDRHQRQVQCGGLAVASSTAQYK